MLKKMIAVAALLSAGSAQAFTFFSMGGAPDKGAASFETILVDFENPATVSGFYNSTGAGVPFLVDVNQAAITSGDHSGEAAAPAFDDTQYMALGNGGSATFNFSTMTNFASLRSLSVYVGSVDLYNYIDVMSGTTSLGTIGGSMLPGNNGDWGSSITNRRLYINFTESEQVTGLRFVSTGVAFEFDDIAGSSRVFAPSGPTPDALPGAVPEPASWAMFMIGFGVLGAGLRRKRLNVNFA